MPSSKYLMRKKANETDEECSARYLANHRRWVSKPGNKEKKYLKDKEGAQRRFREWQKRNPEKLRLKSAMERATRLQRIPTWADLKEINEFYLNCPSGYHVDHIIPLRGRLVNGLHVRQNLQYLPAQENLRKGSRFDP